MAREVSVATFPSRDEAEVARGLLTSAGIDARVTSDDAGGAYPFDLAGGAQVLVDERDLAAATELLAPGRRPGPDTGASGRPRRDR
jgi:hypothetical protein